jgi:hypothetical protein
LAPSRRGYFQSMPPRARLGELLAFNGQRGLRQGLAMKIRGIAGALLLLVQRTRAGHRTIR